jgi:hypothetical protein
VNETEPVRIALWRRVVLLTIGVVFLTTAGAILATDAARFGLDGWNGYLIAVWVLFTVVFVSGLAPDPPRWLGARKLVLGLTLANLPLYMVYIVGPLHADHAVALGVANFSLCLAGVPAALTMAMVRSKPRAGRGPADDS